jgi:hypothetical protein
MANLTQHSLLACLAHQPVMRKLHISQEVDAFVILNKLYFVRVQTQAQFFLQKLLDRGEEILQLRFVGRDDNKVIGVADIVFGFKLVLYKLVKLVHVHVRKQLRSQIADWHTPRVEEVALAGRKAADNFFKQLHYLRILNASCQYLQQYFVVDAVEKLPHIALQCVAGARTIAAHCSEHFRQSLYSFVRALADTTRKGVGDEAGLEHRIKLLKNGVVQHSIAHRRFVDVPELRVGDIKGGVRAVFVCFVSEVAMQLKNVLLQFFFKLHDIVLAPLVLLELVPCIEQVLDRGHVFKYSLVRFHKYD